MSTGCPPTPATWCPLPAGRPEYKAAAGVQGRAAARSGGYSRPGDWIVRKGSGLDLSRPSAASWSALSPFAVRDEIHAPRNQRNVHCQSLAPVSTLIVPLGYAFPFASVSPPGRRCSQPGNWIVFIPGSAPPRRGCHEAGCKMSVPDAFFAGIMLLRKICGNFAF